MFPLQYISDHLGNHTAVVIPIAEWEAIVREHNDLERLELKSTTGVEGDYKMGDFAGTLGSKTADALLSHIEQSRNEWERDI